MNPRGALATEGSQTRSNCSPFGEPTKVCAGSDDDAPAAPEPPGPGPAAAPTTGDTSPAALMKYSCNAAPPAEVASTAPFANQSWVGEEPWSLSASDGE